MQERLDEAMVADHLESPSSTFFGERGATVFLIRDELGLSTSEVPQHTGDRGRSDPEPLRQGRRARPTAPFTDLVNGLQVVFNSVCNHA
jgi:hypothetical protein